MHISYRLQKTTTVHGQQLLSHQLSKAVGQNKENGIILSLWTHYFSHSVRHHCLMSSVQTHL